MSTLKIDQFILVFFGQTVIQKSLQYSVKSNNLIQKGLSYGVVIIPSAITKSLSYDIASVARLKIDSVVFTFEYVNFTTIQKSLEYSIISPVNIQKSLSYQIFNQSLIQKSLSYQIISENLVQKSLSYSVVSSVLIQKSLNYILTNPNQIVKALKYTIVKTVTPVTKSLSYKIVSPNLIQKGLDYRIAVTNLVQKTLSYKIISPVVIQKNIQYSLTAEIQTITIDNLSDRRIYQRDSNDEAAIPISGTYEGAPGTVQARIVDFDTDEEIITWQTIDVSPAGGEFSGDIVGVPVGGWYKVQVRCSSNVAITDEDTSKIAVGIVIALAGQSNAEHFSISPYGEDLTANDLTSVWRTNYQSGDPSSWQVPIYNGDTSLLNSINDVMAIPVGLISGGVGGTGILEGSYPIYWSDPSPSGIYADFINDINLNGGSLEAIFFYQGETEALSGNITGYKAGRAALYESFRSDLDYPFPGTLPILHPTLGRYTLIWGSSDTNWNNMQNIILEMTEEEESVYLAATLIDLPLLDNIHISTDALILAGQRFAQSFLYLKGEVDYYRGPKILGYQLTASNIIDVFIEHSGGTDFTPLENITEFDVLDNGSPETITSAVRLSETSIRLTIAGNITGTPTVRYMYGAYPAITSPVLDNSSINLPLELIDSAPLYQTYTIQKTLDYKLISIQLVNKSLSYKIKTNQTIEKSLVYTIGIPVFGYTGIEFEKIEETIVF